MARRSSACLLSPCTARCSMDSSKVLRVLMDKDLKVLMDKDLKVLELPTASNKDLTASTDSTKDLHSPPTTRTRLVWSTSACSTS